MLRGFLILTLFLILGETFRYILNWPVSSGVLGMLFMTLWLIGSGRASPAVAIASQQLISVLIVLILPGVVGVFFLEEKFNGQWLMVGAALSLGTLLSVVSTLLLMTWFSSKRSDSHEHE